MNATETMRQPADLMAQYKYLTFEMLAHSRGVAPEHVPALWQKYVAQVRRAGEWAMSGAMMTAIAEYQCANQGDYIGEWLNLWENGE